MIPELQNYFNNQSLPVPCTFAMKIKRGGFTSPLSIHIFDGYYSFGLRAEPSGQTLGDLLVGSNLTPRLSIASSQ